MVRGVNGDDIFLDDGDHEYFLKALRLSVEASGASVLAYCLMTNHVHLVLRTGAESIGQTMKRLGVRYAGWFNRKYARRGHLFQDRFLSVPVNDDTYFVQAIRYVWANPVKAGLVASPMEYRWNSCAPGRPSGLVADKELTALLPSLARVDLATPLIDSFARPAASRGGRPPRHSTSEVARMLTACCGARSAVEFTALDVSSKRRAVSQLRTRSVAYRLIAEVTGLSRTGVRRLQLASLDHARNA